MLEDKSRVGKFLDSTKKILNFLLRLTENWGAKELRFYIMKLL